jgi:hypothetical protein
MYLLWKLMFYSLRHICAFDQFCLFYLQRLLNYLVFRSFWLWACLVKVTRNASCVLNWISTFSLIHMNEQWHCIINIKEKRQRNMKCIPFNQYTILLINSMLLLSIQPKLSLQYKIINSANIKKTKPISILA